MIRQIRYFQSVVRNNSFSEAAQECHISQSAISQQIQALEHELGFYLLERKNRRFILTPAGEYFYKKSLVLIADYERMCREAGKLAKDDKAALRRAAVSGNRHYYGNVCECTGDHYRKHEVHIIQIYGCRTVCIDADKLYSPDVSRYYSRGSGAGFMSVLFYGKQKEGIQSEKTTFDRFGSADIGRMYYFTGRCRKKRKTGS